MPAPSIIWNELCVEHQPVFDDEAKARDAMASFVELLSEAKKRGIRTMRMIQQTREYKGIALAIGYNIMHWAKDHKVDATTRTFLLDTLVNAVAPLLDDLGDDHPIHVELKSAHDHEYGGYNAQGLYTAYCLMCVAHPHNTHVAVSLGSHICWDTPELVITLLLGTNEAPEVREVSVPHLSRIHHLDKHRPMRRYEANLKHSPSARLGAYVSPMTLSEEEAQEVLQRAVQIEDDPGHLYGCYEREVYVVFHAHRLGVYHGYCVEEFDDRVRDRIEKAMRDEGLI